MVRREAIPRVRDQKVLAYVAKNDKDDICRKTALLNMNKKDVPPELIGAYYEAQEWQKSRESVANISKGGSERARRDRDIRVRENKRDGHQCPHCRSYNISVRRDAGIHCFDCGRDSLHYLKK